MTTDQSNAQLPLAKLRVLDFGHTVMGPCAGLILADLGAEVIKIEPPNGDPTRRLKGFGTGYFGFFNRNKRSIALDLKSTTGRNIALKLMASADIMLENFAPGTMERLGLGYSAASSANPRLIYASLKGFFDGPYGKRLALDEIVQMMSGLAFMTGPSGRPLRAGASIVDINGGMFAVIGILAALRDRDFHGKGRLIESALFECSVFLVGQHLCYASQSDEPIPPMPERVSAWAVYEQFTLRDGQHLFIGITTDNHWQRFCEEFNLPALGGDPTLTTNNQRIAARPRLIPILREVLSKLTLKEASVLCESARIPFAPICRPDDLPHDPHLQATHGLLDTILPGGIRTSLPRLPLRIEGVELNLRCSPPSIGEHTVAILSEIGFTSNEISMLIGSGDVVEGENMVTKPADLSEGETIRANDEYLFHR